MNYLIVMAKASSRGETTLDVIFPLGIAYVSASLKQAGYAVFTANLEYCEGDAFSILRKLILDNSIDVICTGGLSRDCNKIKELLDAAREINPKIITVVGGGIISSDPEPAMRVLGADIGVIGEGEITMRELAEALDNGLPYASVNGLIYRTADGSLATTPRRKEIADLDEVPFPDFDGFNYGEYAGPRGGLLVGSRSCPARCTYCFHPSGKKYRQRSLDNIFREIDYQVEHYQITAFGLSDELFANNRERIFAFCDRVKSYDLKWACALRVCDVDLEMLKKMKSAGCESICYGLESADDSVLKSMRKGITVEQIEKALQYTYEAGIRVVGQFIFGDIAEDTNTVKRTLDFWRRHNMTTEMSLNMIITYPGSYLYRYACDSGLIKDREQYLRDGCPPVNVSRLTGRQYEELYWLTEELKLHPHTLAKSIRIKDIRQNGECRIEVTCRKCGTRSEVSMFFWFKHAHACPTCSLINEVDPFTIALHSPEAFMNGLPAGEEIALWGAGGIYYKLVNAYEGLSGRNFVLVDANPCKQGIKICNKMVQLPDIIAGKNIKTVLITALSRKDDIYETICERYPSVERVLYPDFEITEDGVVPVLRPMGSDIPHAVICNSPYAAKIEAVAH